VIDCDHDQTQHIERAEEQGAVDKDCGIAQPGGTGIVGLSLDAAAAKITGNLGGNNIQRTRDGQWNGHSRG
jgi:hypothetical protein